MVLFEESVTRGRSVVSAMWLDSLCLVDHVCTQVYIITVRLLWEKGQLIRSISERHGGV